jgi:pimeloyl-ACP methyl ester carboxylesterase
VRRRRRSRGRAAALLGGAAGLAYLGASYLASRRFARALLSPTALGPIAQDRERFLSSLRGAAGRAETFTHEGDPRDPARLVCTFATPGDPASRPTVLFLHGKGGNAAEWQVDALRALAMGANVLAPDLRGHGESGGRLVTYGLLESTDLSRGVSAAAGRFGIDPGCLGVHGCSAGATVALAFASGNPAVRALWLESPYSDPRTMARHYLRRMTGLPPALLAVAAHFAFRRAGAALAARLGRPRGARVPLPDPLAAARKLACPVMLVYGRRDELVPPAFVSRLLEALPSSSEAWQVEGAGHCHHADEAQAVCPELYSRRWILFFRRNLFPTIPSSSS